MKKKWMLVLAGVLVISTLAACGKAGKSSKGLSDDNITISQYKGVEVEKTKTESVTAEAVDQEIQSTRYANRIMNEVTDRGAKEGDVVSLNYTGLSNGEKFDEGTLDVEIGNSSLIEGFEEGLVGHKAEEDFELNLTFPENYTVNPDLSGAPAVFQIHINTVTEQTLPELNDEFVQNVSETSKTVEEYREEVKKSLKKANKASAEELKRTTAWEKVLGNTKVKKYPEEDVKKQTDMIVKQYKSLATGYGLEFKDFLSQMMNGMTEEAFGEEAEKVSRDAVKQDMAVALIAKTEKLEMSKKEIEKTLEEYRVKYGFETVDQMKEAIGEDYLMKDMQLTKVKEWVAENCKIVEKKEEK